MSSCAYVRGAALALASALTFSPPEAVSTAIAQDSELGAEPPPAEPARSPEGASEGPHETTDHPPRIIFLPTIVWPSAEALPAESAVEALLVIGRDGLGQLAGCELNPLVCDAIELSLLGAAFEPAQVSGKATPAKVRVRFVIVPEEAPKRVVPMSPEEKGRAPEPTNPDDERLAVSEDPGFGARATVERPRPTARSLELAQMREVPGAFGDPFRVIDTLPGVVPVITGLPFVYVRGAPPASTAYFFDGIPMPALFHLGLGPAVVHPAMVGPIDFYAGVAPARYGRKTGGVVSGKAALRPLKRGVHGELELRLIDMQAYVAKSLKGGGRLELAGRYGYPGLALKILEPTAVFQYWDYQLRSVIPLSPKMEAQFVVLGSYDLIGTREGLKVSRDLELQFHRAEARLVFHETAYTYGCAVMVGFERSGLGDNLNVQAFRTGPRLWIDTMLGKASLRVGADMIASTGKIYSERNNDEDDGESRPPNFLLPVAAPSAAQNTALAAQADPPNAAVLTAMSASTQSTLLGERFGFRASSNDAFLAAAGRNVLGAYAELGLPLSRAWDVETGVRTDTWMTAGRAQPAFEPRAVLRYQPTEALVLHTAFGLSYQPAVFQIPLPGIADVALDRGLQRAIQSELGGALALPRAFNVESTVFAHFYANMIGFDRPPRPPPCAPEDLARQTCPEAEPLSRFSARSLGSEWLIRRDYRESLSGFLSYTWSKSVGQYDDGRALVPPFDIRHVGNLVLQWRINERWMLALRGYGQSGRFPLAGATEIDPRKRARLPAFYRGDTQLARIWQRSWGELRLTFDWLNFTLQRDPFEWDCGTSPLGSSDRCAITYVPFPITLPMLSIRGTY